MTISDGLGGFSRALAQESDLVVGSEIAPDMAPEETIVTQAQIDDVIASLDTFYLLLSGYLVFFMQCGFCMLSAGSVRQKNAKNIILKNLLDACFGALGWYFFGFGIAYGTDERAIGRDGFAFHDVGLELYATWFFQYAFAATAATIVSGAVAERTKFEAYLLYAFFLTSWVYPNVVSWVWNPDGWLSAFTESKMFDSGMLDFAGCGVVHMVGGFAGFAGAFLVGPRLGRFDEEGRANNIPGHSASLALLGVFILWLGWFGFNPGSTLAVANTTSAYIAANCAVTTTLAAATGTISTLVILMIKNYMSTGKIVWDVIGAGNGALGGLVSITASCSIVEPWAAIIIGIIGGAVYILGSNIMVLMKIDDPLDAVAVHGFCGMWGLIAVGCFADKQLIEKAYGDTYYDSNNAFAYGFFLGGDGKLLAAGLVGIIVILGWVLIHMMPFFCVLKYVGLLRVSQAEEHEGLDTSHHGGTAYPVDMISGKEKVLEEGVTSSKGAPQRDIFQEMDEMKQELQKLKG